MTRSADEVGHAVVIAGGGPTGLMLAAELTLAGVDVVVVERRANQDLDGSRAGGLHSRTIEILDQRGVVERFLSAGQQHPFVGYAGIVLDITDFPTRHNYLLALWQRDFERILAGWIEELGVPILRRARGGGFRPGRIRGGCRAVRRHLGPYGVPRRVRRRSEPRPQDGRHRLSRLGSDDQFPHRRGRDGRRAADRHATRGWRRRARQPGRGWRAVSGRAARGRGGTRRRADAPVPPRGARRGLRDGLRRAQPDLDFPLHRHDATGGHLPRPAGAARRRRRARARPTRRAGPQRGGAGRGEPGMEVGPGGERHVTGTSPRHVPR